MRNLLTSLVLGLILTDPSLAQRPWLQWQPENGIQVRSESNFVWLGAAATRITGNDSPQTAIVWTASRNGVPATMLQFIDGEGNFSFPDTSLKISSFNERKWYPTVEPDADGGWFVCWHEIEGGLLDEEFSIRYIKVFSDGTLLWNEGRLNAPPTTNGDGRKACLSFPTVRAAAT